MFAQGMIRCDRYLIHGWVFVMFKFYVRLAWNTNDIF